jgi:hypothetical protein
VTRLFGALIVATFAIASPAVAQKPQVSIVMPDQAMLSREAPAVRSRALITDGTMLDLIRNGFPARLHYRMERWSTGGWFDDIAAEAEWDVVVRYDALSKLFQVYRIVGKTTTSLGSYENINDAEAAIDAPFTAPISAPRRGRKSYYNLVLDIETL